MLEIANSADYYRSTRHLVSWSDLRPAEKDFLTILDDERSLERVVSLIQYVLVPSIRGRPAGPRGGRAERGARGARGGWGISNRVARYDFNEFLDDTKSTTAGTGNGRITLSPGTVPGFDLKVRPGIERGTPRG